MKDPTEFTGPESYVYNQVKVTDFTTYFIEVVKCWFVNNVIKIFQKNLLEWFPRMQAMSLTAGDEADENSDVRNLSQQLETTTKLVSQLSKQLQV